MKIFHIFFIAIFFILSSSCRKEKIPLERIELSNATYAVNCLNCKQYGQNGTVYDYSSVKMEFNFSSKKARISNDSYLLVVWKFTGGTSGDYMIDYNDLTIAGDKISFDGSWAWGSTTNLRLEVILYSGMGSKSNVLGIDIPKPAGSNRMSDPAFTEPSSGGFSWEETD